MKLLWIVSEEPSLMACDLQIGRRVLKKDIYQNRTNIPLFIPLMQGTYCIAVLFGVLIVTLIAEE